MGTNTWPSGEVSKGEWKDNKLNGIVTCTLPSGERYEGQWKDGKRNGMGTNTWASGQVSKGEWKDGKLNGIGTCTLPSGERYEGQLKDGNRNGLGTLTFPCGDVYKGEWKEDKKHGHGIYRYANGVVYNGEWENDKRHGLGTCTLINGNIYHGKFKNGYPYCQRTFTFTNGNEIIVQCNANVKRNAITSENVSDVKVPVPYPLTYGLEKEEKSHFRFDMVGKHTSVLNGRKCKYHLRLTVETGKNGEYIWRGTDKDQPFWRKAHNSFVKVDKATIDEMATMPAHCRNCCSFETTSLDVIWNRTNGYLVGDEVPVSGLIQWKISENKENEIFFRMWNKSMAGGFKPKTSVEFVSGCFSPSTRRLVVHGTHLSNIGKGAIARDVYDLIVADDFYNVSGVSMGRDLFATSRLEATKIDKDACHTVDGVDFYGIRDRNSKDKQAGRDAAAAVDEEESQMCIICEERKRNIVFIPCKHLCLCDNCFQVDGKIDKCPMCREVIKDSMKVFV